MSIPRLQDLERAGIEIHITDIYLIAYDVGAPRPVYPLPQGEPVIRFAGRKCAHLLVALTECLGDLDGSIRAAVLGDDQLVGSVQARKARDEIVHRGRQYPLLVVHGDYDTEDWT